MRNVSAQRWMPVLVTPAITIATSSVANPTVVTTSTPHGLSTGDTVAIDGHTGSTPAVSGTYIAVVATPLTFTVSVHVTIGGTGGTVTRRAPAAVITIEDAKAHVRDPENELEDEQFARWIATATLQVERETSIELLPKTYDIAGDWFPAYGCPIELLSGPLLSVTHVKYYNSANVLQTMTASDYTTDTSRIPGRIGLADNKTWPTDLRQFQPVTFRVIVGFASVKLIPDPLMMAVRIAMAWHSANREPTCMERASFDWLISPYARIGVA